MTYGRTIAIAALCALIGAGAVAFAQRTNYLGTVFVADKTTPAQQLTVNADGSINVVGGGGVTPTGATATTGSATGTTAATSATLAADAAKTEYVCAISIRVNATAAATGNATLSDGTITLNFTQWTAPLASGLGVNEQMFNPCLPASAVNTAWTLTSAAAGSGGVVSVSIWGFKK